ncbi:MAG: FadR family transcriptional regulator [Bacteroidales bacterium]|nr:FadR family transcriptional regulator [Bacteroidales bacterium]
MERTSKSTGLVDQAVLKLREYILSKGYNPGDVLPGEIELAEQLGVSRTIIREALSRFRMFGIVDSRRRRGMILQSPDFLKGMEMALVSAWLGAGTLRELFEFRLMLEIGLADLLFEKKSDKLYKKLARIIEREDQAGSESERMKADAEFHSALYAATENQTLIRFQDILYPLFKQYASEKVNAFPKPIIDHARLLKELETGSTASFRLAMRHHLEPHFQVQSNETDYSEL